MNRTDFYPLGRARIRGRMVTALFTILRKLSECARVLAPCFDGRSPTDGENSTSPEIKSAVSNFPLHINIPASRPTLPSRNSTGPEKVTEFPSPRVHVPSEGFAAPHTLDLGSVAIKVPFPSACASKRIERCSAFAKVISTFHAPVMLGVWACARALQHICAITIRSTLRRMTNEARITNDQEAVLRHFVI